MKPARRRIERASPRYIVCTYRGQQGWYIVNAATHRRDPNDPSQYPTLSAALWSLHDRGLTLAD